MQCVPQTCKKKQHPLAQKFLIKNCNLQLQIGFQTDKEYFATVKYWRHHPEQEQCHHAGP